MMQKDFNSSLFRLVCIFKKKMETVAKNQLIKYSDKNKVIGNN